MIFNIQYIVILLLPQAQRKQFVCGEAILFRDN